MPEFPPIPVALDEATMVLELACEFELLLLL
jgi:hypothetical protein